MASKRPPLINPLNKLIDDLTVNVDPYELERIRCYLDGPESATHDTRGYVKLPWQYMGFSRSADSSEVTGVSACRYAECAELLRNLKREYPDDFVDICEELFTNLDSENGRKNLAIIERYKAKYADVSTRAGDSLPPPYCEDVVQTYPKEVAVDPQGPHVSLPPYFADVDQTQPKEMDVDSNIITTSNSSDQQTTSDELQLDL